MSNPLDPRNQLKITTNPIQQAGQDELLRRTIFGGPETNRDVRLYLDVKTLSHLLEVARQAASQTAVINRAGLCIQVYKADNGHCYEVWRIIGDKPEPVRIMGV